jgi:hypothetical protein
VFYGVLFGDGKLFYGRVVDFIDVDFFDLNLFGYHLSRWPVFNIADSSVTCGVILLLFSHHKKTEETALMQIEDTTIKNESEVKEILTVPSQPTSESNSSQ